MAPAPADAIRLDPGTAADLEAVVAFLTSAGLPTDDLDAASARAFLVARHGKTLVGTVAVDRAGAWGLLRSLAVAPVWRGRGRGRRLVRAAEIRAAADGVRHLALLTTSAAPFFLARGYTPVDRTALPDALRRHPQVAGLCPASAVCLMRELS